MLKGYKQGLLVYPEVAIDNVIDAPFPAFPTVCPGCKGRIVEEDHSRTMSCMITVTYACGGQYVHKSQIQNHTMKWWGYCPVTPDSHEPPAQEVK